MIFRKQHDSPNAIVKTNRVTPRIDIQTVTVRVVDVA